MNRRNRQVVVGLMPAEKQELRAYLRRVYPGCAGLASGARLIIMAALRGLEEHDDAEEIETTETVAGGAADEED